MSVFGGFAVALMVSWLSPDPSTAQTTTPPASTGQVPDTKPAKIPDQLPQTNEQPAAPQPSPPASAPAPSQDGTATPGTDSGGATPAAPADNNDSADQQDDVVEEPNIGEIPDIKSVELTAQTAKNAIDTYMLLKEKYKDARLEDYESLQEFVDKDTQGKAFDADVRAAGFADVESWNQTITSVSTTIATLLNDQTAETKAQIAEVEKDTDLAQDMKDKLINSLKALIPSDNNKKIVAELQKDPSYADKLKQLESEEE